METGPARPDDPPALAVINPKRRDCPYPDKYLAGVGVALKLVQALCRRAQRESWLPGFIKIAAIGFVIYLLIRIFSPETARRLREKWSGPAV